MTRKAEAVAWYVATLISLGLLGALFVQVNFIFIFRWTTLLLFYVPLLAGTFLFPAGTSCTTRHGARVSDGERAATWTAMSWLASSQPLQRLRGAGRLFRQGRIYDRDPSLNAISLYGNVLAAIDRGLPR